FFRLSSDKIIQLQLDSRQRRSQLVGGIRREIALHRNRFFQFKQQAVQSAHNRLNFLGRAGNRQRVHPVGIPTVNSPRQSLQRRQAAPHGIPNSDNQQNEKQDKGQQRAPRAFANHCG